MIRTFKFQPYVDRHQHDLLKEILLHYKDIYNSALEERQSKWRKKRKSTTYFDQCYELAELRKDKDYTLIPLRIQRGAILQLDANFKAFFTNIKKGNKNARPPRYKSVGRTKSFSFAEFNGIAINGNRIRFKYKKKYISLKIPNRIELPESKPKSCQYKLKDGVWWIYLQYDIPKIILEKNENAVGIDVGLTTLCTLSDGSIYRITQFTKDNARELRIKQRKLARCKNGSNNRKKVKLQVTKIHSYIANSRDRYLNYVAKDIVRSNQYICLEKLDIQNMISQNKYNKSIANASWNKLQTKIVNKAEESGRTVIFVNAKNTSQLCSGCEKFVKKDLYVRQHDCPHCGLSICRDLNASINILKRGNIEVMRMTSDGCSNSSLAISLESNGNDESHAINKDQIDFKELV